MGSLCNKKVLDSLSPEEEKILKSEKELELFEVPCHQIIKSAEYISEITDIDSRLIPNWLESIGIDSSKYYGDNSRLGLFFKELSKDGRIQKITLETMGVLLGQGIVAKKSALLYNIFKENTELTSSEVTNMLSSIAEVAVKLVLIADSSLTSYYEFLKTGVQPFVEANLAEICEGNDTLSADEFAIRMNNRSLLLSTTQIRTEINKHAKIKEGIP